MTDAIRTARLLIRCWRQHDAPRLKEAIDASLSELQAYLPWAMQEPSSIEAIAARIAGMRQKFATGEDWAFGVFDAAETQLLGGAGLHPRGRTDHLEIGYWLRSDVTGRGYATEAAAALCPVAFAHTSVDHIEIHCDAGNRGSAAVAARLGFTLARTCRRAAVTAGGAEREMLVWTLPRAAALEHARGDGG